MDIETSILALIGRQEAMLVAVSMLIASHPDPASAQSAWQQLQHRALAANANDMERGSIRADALRDQLHAFQQQIDRQVR